MNQIIHGDSLEYMKTLPDKSIDLVLTDPPYGLGDKLLLGGKNGKVVNFHKQYANTDWNDVVPSDEMFKEIFRISKNQIIFGGNYFPLPPTRGIICWDKNIGTPDNFSHWEMAWTSFDKPAKKFVKTNDSNKEHPTQKPKELFKWCLENYSKPGDLILDCFAGSGTTAVACIETGRDYIVIEKEADYVEIIKKRVKNTTPPLFVM